MKIIATICDQSAMIYAGGEIERISFILEIPDDSIPQRLQEHLDRRPKHHPNESMSLSLVEIPS